MNNPKTATIIFNVKCGHTEVMFLLGEDATVIDIKCRLELKLALPFENQVILRKYEADWIVLNGDEALVFPSEIENQAQPIHELQINLRCLYNKEIPPQIRVLSNQGPWSATGDDVFQFDTNDFLQNNYMCTLHGFKAHVRDKINAMSEQYWFLYTGNYKQKTVILDTEHWLATLKEYGLFHKTLNIHLGMFNPTSSPVCIEDHNNMLHLPIVKITSTQDEELLRWQPDSETSNTVSLMKFIESQLEIPIQYQTLYYCSKKLSKSQNLIPLLLSNANTSVLTIHLAYKTFPNTPGNVNEMEEFINELGLQKLRSVQIKDLDTNMTVVENALDSTLNSLAGYDELTHIINDKLGQTFDFKLIKSGKTLDKNIVIEDLFYGKDGEFCENVELNCSLNTTLTKPGEALNYHFRMYGLKKLVITSITKVVHLDALNHKSLDKLRGHIECEWNIPKHCQVYMHNGRKIEHDSHESLLMIFKYGTTEEEKNQNSLRLNLITLEPNDITIYLNCPHRQKIGLPETVKIKETSTVLELENVLSDMANTMISVYPRNPPTKYNHDEFSLPRERVHLYSLIISDQTPKLSLRVFRTLKVNIDLNCKKCDIAHKQEKKVTVKDGLNDVRDVMEFIFKKYQQHHCSHYGLCKRQNLKLLKVNGNSTLTMDSTLADLPVDCVLNFKTYWTFKSLLRGALRREPKPLSCG